MPKYRATIRATFEVEFEDNGKDEHKTQAVEAFHEMGSTADLSDAFIEILSVEPDRTEFPDVDRTVKPKE